ncbi:MAG: hypothetical protein JNM17_11410 [Archangium sp.]|nr:hypothetical protein [Archangium sp.]
MKRFVFVAALWAGLAFADIAPVPPPAPAPAAVHPEGIENVPTGVIQGGWGYVYACYIVAIGGTIFYALSLFARRPRGSPGKSGPQS